LNNRLFYTFNLVKLIAAVKLKKAIILFLLVLAAASCTPVQQSTDYIGTWTAVKKVGSVFYQVDCGYPGEKLLVSTDSVYHKGLMEDFAFKADHVKAESKQTTIYPGQKEQLYYRFTWVDKQHGIAKWDVSDNGVLVSRYFVNQPNLKNVKAIKGTLADCVTNNTGESQINDSLAVGNSNILLFVDNDTCITIKNREGDHLYQRCFDGVTLKIRPEKGNFLPLTFISGPKSMDLDFYQDGKDWTSRSVTYYSGVKNTSQKVSQPMMVSINHFDFENVAGQFDKLNKTPIPALADLENPAKLQNMDVYRIADILAAAPVNQTNLPVYSKAASDLIDAEMYNEARIILLELVKASPKNAQLFLKLGDAQWGFEDESGAKKSYQTYITLAKLQGNGEHKIPQRVIRRTQ
jgi:hypothetical protein